MNAVLNAERQSRAERQDSSGPRTAPGRRDPGAARRFLELLRTPAAGCTEFRVLHGVFQHDGQIRRGGAPGRHDYGATLAGWYDRVEPLLRDSRRLYEVTGYVTINPVRADLLARSANSLAHVRHTTRDVDVLCLRWLYLDIDPVRPPDISSTSAELALALARRDAILADNPELAASALWGCSGNGAWILVRLPDYPNDPTHRELVKEVVRLLADKYNDGDVIIDTATVNPARLISVPGSIKAKGSPLPERPWRFVTLDGAGQ
jgi:hypothetical protein